MQITMQTLPTTLAEFEALPRQSPEQVSALFLCALKLYLTDKDAGVAAISKRPSAATSDTYPSERSEMRTSSGEWAHGTGSTKKKYDSVCR